MYCNYCGKLIPDGEVCQCEESQKERTTAMLSAGTKNTESDTAGEAAQVNYQEKVNDMTKKVKGLTGQAIDVAKNFVKDATSTLITCEQQEDMRLGIYLYIVKTIMVALMATLIVVSKVNAVMGAFDMGMGVVDSILLFIKVLVFSGITDIALWAVVYGVSRMFKCNVSKEGIFVTLEIAAMPLILAAVAVGILAMFSLSFAGFAFAILAIYYVIVSYNAIDLLLKLDRNKFIQAYFLIAVALLLLAYFCGRVGMNSVTASFEHFF